MVAIRLAELTRDPISVRHTGWEHLNGYKPENSSALAFRYLPATTCVDPMRLARLAFSSQPPIMVDVGKCRAVSFLAFFAVIEVAAISAKRKPFPCRSSRRGGKAGRFRKRKTVMGAGSMLDARPWPVAVPSPLFHFSPVDDLHRPRRISVLGQPK